MRNNRAALVARRLSLFCLVILCAAAGGSTASYTLIVGSRIPLGPLHGVTAMYAYSPVSGLVADLNGDGAPDIVIGINGEPPAVYLNNGTSNPFQNVEGVFVGPLPAPNSSGLGWGAAVLADVNADGHPDLALAGFNSPNLIYLNNGTAGAFSGANPIPIGTEDVAFEVAFGDVNGDGFVDMAVSNTNHIPSRLYLTNGAPLTSGTYTTVQIGTDVGYGQDVKIADVNGDGKPDIILTYTVASSLATDPTGIAIYLNNGTSAPFVNVTPIRLLAGTSVNAIAVADLNGDGKLDLVAAVSDQTSTTNNLYVFLNTGSASAPFGSSQILKPDTDLGGGCFAVSVGDVNGDGLPDLLFGCAASVVASQPLSPAVGAIYLNNGTASPFANVAPVDIPSTPDSNFALGVAVGTFVKGGIPDVLVVDGGNIIGGQGGLAGYDPTKFDQDPVAQNDTGVCAINKPIQIDLLANDSAASGETLDATSITLAAAAQHGTATVNATTGSVTYQPATGYSGSDSFQYTVRDNYGALSNTAIVSIRVQPAPVAVNDTATIPANQSATLSVLSNDTSAGGTLNTATIKIVVAPAHGSAAATNGAVKYTPTAGYSGLDTFQYSIEDNLGTPSNAATVSLDVTAPPSSGGGGGSEGILDIALLMGIGLLRLNRRGRAPASARQANISDHQIDADARLQKIEG